MGNITQDVDFLLRFESPIQLKLDSGISSVETQTILPDYPNESYKQVSIQQTDNVVNLYRYSGEYNIKFKPLIKFKDDYFVSRWSSINIKWSDAYFKWIDSNKTVVKINWVNINGSWVQHPETWNEANIDKNSINQDLIPFYDGLVGKNTKFDTNDSSFGVIKNIFYHRVNSQNLAILKTLNPVYKSVDEIAIKNRDVSVFSSNWDYNYYTETNARFNESLLNGMIEMKEQQAYLGSKLLKTPKSLNMSDYTIATGVDINNISYVATADITYEFKNSSIIFRLDFSNKLSAIIFENSNQEFKKFLNKYYTKTRDVDQSINDYIDLNIIPTYILSKYNLYVKKFRAGSNPVVNNIDFVAALQNGYIPDINFQNQTLSRLESIITYKIDPTYQYSFVFDITISKI